MTDDDQPNAKKNFIFGEPSDFFAQFAKFLSIGPSLRGPLLAFRTNLSSAFRVGSIPFQLTQNAVLNQRYNQLLIAARIRGRASVIEGSLPPNEEDEAISKAAHTSMAGELADPEMIDHHAKATLTTLRGHLQNPEFRATAQELLRQVLVITWGAFENLVSDTIRVLMNERPTIILKFMETKSYRDLFSSRRIMEVLETNNFNLSSCIGDFFCETANLDSLEKISEALHISITQPSLDVMLKDERLWRISQQRHLIVHRRGLIDARYLERTSDHGVIGEQLILDANYVEASLSFIRDVGCALLEAAQQRLEID